MIARLACLAVLALLTGPAPVYAAAQPSGSAAASVEAYARTPDIQSPRLSPDGRHLAYLSEYDGEPVLAVLDFSGGPLQIASLNDVGVNTLRWASDRYLLMSASESRIASWADGGRITISAVLSVDVDNGLRTRQLLQDSRFRGRTSSLGTIAGIDPQTGRVLIPTRNPGRRYDLIATDPGSSTETRESVGSENTRAWALTADGDVAARMDFARDGQRRRILVPENGGWREILEEAGVFRPDFRFSGMLDADRIGLVQRPVGGPVSTRALYALSTQTGEISDPVFQDPRYDLETVIIDPHTNRVVGVRYQDMFTRHHWFDPTLASFQDQLSAALPAQMVRITDWSRDRQRILFVAESPTQAARHFMLDLSTGQIQAIGSTHPELDGLTLPVREFYEYPVRDGTMISGYLTRPTGDGPHPTVILPHPGPVERDTGGFDPYAHYLASRGYAVLQPNYRGSSGMGFYWERGGQGQWGDGRAQTDLEDGAQALISQDVAIAGRICIAGAGYGGYAALAGVALTPELYACAAAFGGISDLPGLMEEIRRSERRDHWAWSSWSRLLGGDADLTQSRTLIDISPSTHVEAVSAPVLLVHDQADEQVPVAQSRAFAARLEAQGIAVQLLEIENDNQGLTTSTARALWLRELEAFLDRHIGE